jgi:hypothetical protein
MKTKFLLKIKVKYNKQGSKTREFLIKVPTVLFRLYPVFPLSFSIKLTYLLRMEKKLDLRNPRDFNEKIQWLKTYYRDPLYIICADKYRVREYVERCGYKHILNELYGVYEKSEDIRFEELPDRFALKCNHAAATNIICDDKNSLDLGNARVQLNQWLKKRIGYSGGELHYNYIKPLIIAEKNLASLSGNLPIDYKIFCFNGEPKYIAIYSDRDRITLKVKRAFFDFDWNPQNFVLPKDATDPSNFKKPDLLYEMYKIAKKLSEPFPFVRVDLYAEDNKIIFGELTFTPTGGFGKSYTKECFEEFGELLILPEKSKSTRWHI